MEYSMSDDWMERAIKAGANRREADENADQADKGSTQDQETVANELWQRLRTSVETDAHRYNARAGEADQIKIRESSVREVTYSKRSSSSEVTLVMSQNTGLTLRTRFRRGPHAGVSGTEGVSFRVEGDRFVLELPSVRSDTDDLVQHILEDLIES
jgi:hypothetical protein